MPDKKQTTVIDPANNEKPVYFFDDDFDKQQMSCELMDLREENTKLKQELELERRANRFWKLQALEAFELTNRKVYEPTSKGEGYAPDSQNND